MGNMGYNGAMIVKYYRCIICEEFKPIEYRARRYCSKSCRAKAYYNNRGKELYIRRRELEKARAWAEAEAKREHIKE